MNPSLDLWHKFLDHGQVHPVFQPIVSLAAPRYPIGFEALSRPADADGHPLPVGELSELAERTGHAADFDRVCIQAIADHLAHLGVADPTRIFVNVSPTSLLTDREVLAPLAPFARRTVLEITEGALVRDAETAQFSDQVATIRSLGFLFALDDCGAAYSGLSRLLMLRPSYAKIDMPLVRNVDRDSARAVLCDTLIQFAHHLGSRVIAEGIETAAEAATLRELHADFGQGYLFGRPSEERAESAPDLTGLLIPPAPLDMRESLGAVLSLAVRASQGIGGEARIHETALHAVRRAVRAGHCVLRKLDGERLSVVASDGPFPILPTLLLDDGDISSEAARDAVTVVRQRSFLELSGQLITELAVPVRLGTTVWGVLALALLGPDQVRSDLVDFAEGIAALLGLILAADGLAGDRRHETGPDAITHRSS